MKTKFSTRILAFVLIIALVVPTLVFNVGAEDTVITFNLGSDGTANKETTSSKTTYSETVDGYTLSITGGDKMYPACTDATGKGCIKFGSSKAVGKCSFTVPADVTTVKLHVAKYKANTSKVSVNGTTYTLSGSSNAGTYDIITVDTSSTKTVNFTTVSGGVRAMLNTIEFIIPGADVGEPETPVPSISISSTLNYVQVGDDLTLEAITANTTGKVTWTSSDTNVADVDEDGIVTGNGMGKTTITAEVDGIKATKEVSVYPVANSEVTIAQAIEIAKLAGTENSPYAYYVTGVISSFKEEYTDEYKNVSFFITDGSDEILIFRLKAEGVENLSVGHKVVIGGKLVNYSSNTPEFVEATYELILEDTTEAILEALNKIEAKMSLAYKYEASIEKVEVPGAVTDTLDNAFTVNSSGTTYSSWSGKNGISGAVYAGNSAGGNSAIQLRSNNSNSGIVTTVSGGKIKSITITWNTNTSAGRVLNIYASNTAYTAATDLYNTDNQGTKVASFTYAAGEETQKYEFTEDYAYIGIRSNSGALYLDSVVIEWETGAGTGETESKEIYKNSAFAFRFGVDATLANIEGVDSYGIMVTADGKTMYYTTDASSWAVDGGLCYVTVNLGDIINDTKKLGTEFTVKAYVEIDGVKYASEMEKTYSVASIVAYYYDENSIEAVAHLYEYLKNAKLI